MHKYTASPLRGHQLHAVLLCQELNFTVSQYQCRSCISRYRIIVHNIHGHGLNLAPLVANNCISCNPPTPRAHPQHHSTTLPPPATTYHPTTLPLQAKTHAQNRAAKGSAQHICQANTANEVQCSSVQSATDGCQYQCWKVVGAGKINFGQFDKSKERQSNPRMNLPASYHLSLIDTGP